jgi:hypothetical protein
MDECEQSQEVNVPGEDALFLGRGLPSLKNTQEFFRFSLKKAVSAIQEICRGRAR